ncbi:RasGEF domain-containing protein [Legionella shakespearei]|uniref:RasGEF domain protein n=1 Tax=Legionella shakespearei DSM 23087 TaxID=1122169 RepID=A0A0W0Z0E7_9GAMM|nr:RasGEF domain-containing protein [Legionella shakespearei]KTD62351.1 RasGEF domain protein [Legionella shakespearei DSM 23087]
MALTSESEAKGSFISWFYHNPLRKSLTPSQEWDKKTTEPEVNAVIAGSKSIRKLYKQTERSLANDYAQLLDFKLREAFQNIDRKDIANPAGFSDISRASRELKNFFECRKIFEKLIADDIAGHSERAAQISAYSRWVVIAKLLLKRHNYEGASLVLLRLSQIDMRLGINKELSPGTQKSLDSLNKLIFPHKNFKDMREYIRSHQTKNDLPPTFLLSKDMTFLNEALGNDRDLSSKNIPKSHPSYRNVVRKERMLNQLFSAKSTATTALSTHQEAMFKSFSERYQQQLLLSQEDNLPAQSRQRSRSANATLQKPATTTPSPVQAIVRERSKSMDERSLKKAKNEEAKEKQLDKDLASAKIPSSLSTLSFFWRPELCSPDVLIAMAPFIKPF